MRRVVFACLASLPILAPAAQAAESAVGVDQRGDLTVTVFANGQALVQETRPLTLLTGPNTIVLDGMPDRLRPETVLVKSNCAIPFSFKSIAFDSAVMSQSALLRAHLGQSIGVMKKDPASGAERIVPARVLSATEPPVLEIGGQVVSGVTDPLVFKTAPGNLRPAPALSVALDAQGSGSCPTSIAYLADGLSWQADYTAILTQDDTALRLIGGATVVNASGGDFKGATLKAVAGHMNREGGVIAPIATKSLAMADAALAPREAIGGLHRYDLGTAIDLRAGRISRLPLLSAATTATVERTYVDQVWTHQARGGERATRHPNVALTAAAPPESIPLPAGAVRVFRPDAAGTLSLAGETRIDDTAAGQAFSLTLSEDMDITIERTQTAFKRLGQRSVETSERLVVHNAKGDASAVSVRIEFPGEGRLVKAAPEATRVDSGAAVWTLSVPAGGSATIDFTATVSY